MTIAPFNPWGMLVYASRGMEFAFSCRDANEYCPGVRRGYEAFGQAYFVPMSILDWLRLHDYKDSEFYLRPWTGFID